MSVFLVKPIFPVNCGNHPVSLRALSLNLGGDPTSWSLVSGVHINRSAPPPHTHTHTREFIYLSPGNATARETGDSSRCTARVNCPFPILWLSEACAAAVAFRVLSSTSNNPSGQTALLLIDRPKGKQPLLYCTSTHSPLSFKETGSTFDGFHRISST